MEICTFRIAAGAPFTCLHALGKRKTAACVRLLTKKKKRIIAEQKKNNNQEIYIVNILFRFVHVKRCDDCVLFLGVVSNTVRIENCARVVVTAVCRRLLTRYARDTRRILFHFFKNSTSCLTEMYFVFFFLLVSMCARQ